MFDFLTVLTKFFSKIASTKPTKKDTPKQVKVIASIINYMKKKIDMPLG